MKTEHVLLFAMLAIFATAAAVACIEYLVRSLREYIALRARRPHMSRGRAAMLALMGTIE